MWDEVFFVKYFSFVLTIMWFFMFFCRGAVNSWLGNWSVIELHAGMVIARRRWSAGIILLISDVIGTRKAHHQSENNQKRHWEISILWIKQIRAPLLLVGWRRCFSCMCALCASVSRAIFNETAKLNRRARGIQFFPFVCPFFPSNFRPVCLHWARARESAGASCALFITPPLGTTLRAPPPPKKT